jgi:hypothetical protein
MVCTSLYIKKHNVTGLMYLGVTTKNPYVYLGSGLYWAQHIKKHGHHIMTCVIGEFEDLEECSKVALEYSKKYDVVMSDKWANLKPENAKDGWVPGFPQEQKTIERRVLKLIGQKRTEETKKKISDSRLGDKHWFHGVVGEESHWYGRKHTEESINKMRAAKLGKKQSEETKAKRRVSSLGENNGFFGKKHSEETKALIRLKRCGIAISDQHRERVSGLNSKSAKYFIATAPDGIAYTGYNLSLFSTQNGLSCESMCAVARGVQKSHKGWSVNYV